MNARWVPLCVGVPAPANEEADGTRNRPSPNISTSIHRPIKIGPPVTSAKNSGVTIKFLSLLPAQRSATRQPRPQGLFRSGRYEQGGVLADRRRPGIAGNPTHRSNLNTNCSLSKAVEDLAYGKYYRALWPTG
jgi:hypothetical protein